MLLLWAAWGNTTSADQDETQGGFLMSLEDSFLLFTRRVYVVAMLGCLELLCGSPCSFSSPMQAWGEWDVYPFVWKCCAYEPNSTVILSTLISSVLFAGLIREQGRKGRIV